MSPTVTAKLRGITIDARSAISIVLVTGLSTAATFGLRSLTADWSFVVPALVGAAASAAVVETARRIGLLFGETLAVSIAAFTVVGALVVGGGAPSPGAFGQLFEGVTGSWSLLLSAVPPVELTPDLRVAPFALAWIAALIGTGLLRWGGPPGIPVTGPLVALALTVLLTEEDRSLSIVLGTAIAISAIALALLRRSSDPSTGITPPPETTDAGTSEVRNLRLVRTSAALVVVAVMAPVVGPRLPLAESRDRFDLREQLVPPWDPLSVPSPLVQVKASLLAERADDVVFSVESDVPISRWNLAVMGTYDGVVWTVASPDAGPEREFRPVGPRLPPPDDQPVDDPQLTATVTLRDVPGPWLPTPGWPTAISIDPNTARTDGTGATSSRTGPVVRENVRTGTLAVAEGLAPGTTYEISALTPPGPPTEELLEASVPELAVELDLEVLPPQIRNLTADITQGNDRGWAQVEAIRDRFTVNGFYDRSPSAVPGHSFYRLAIFLADPDQVVGYEEQYAAAAAVMTRVIGLPSRVVVGYDVPVERYEAGRADVLAGDISAWIEVLVDDVGWVPVDVTPPRTREPESDAAVAPREQVATPNPPPPPRAPPNVEVVTDNRDVEDLVEEDEDDDEEHDEDDSETLAAAGGGWLRWIILGGGGIGGLLLALALLVVSGKALVTRSRRRAADPPVRIAGAWHEFADRCREAGLPNPRRTTPLETALLVMTADPGTGAAGPELIALVRAVDRSAYHAEPPAEHDADEAWTHYDSLHRALLNGRTRWHRARMRLDPRPLLHRRAAERPDR